MGIVSWNVLGGRNHLGMAGEIIPEIAGGFTSESARRSSCSCFSMYSRASGS